MWYIIAAAVAVLVAWWKGTAATVEEVAVNRSRVPSMVLQWREEVMRAAHAYSVPFEIAMAVMWVESAGDPTARGSAGEIGLFQLKEIAVKDLKVQGYGWFDGWQKIPSKNIAAGVAYLDLQHKRTGNWPDAIEAYNQGYAGRRAHPERAADYLAKVRDKMKFFE